MSEICRRASALLPLGLQGGYLCYDGENRLGILVDGGIHHFPLVGNGRRSLRNALLFEDLHDALCPFHILGRRGVDPVRGLDLARVDEHPSLVAQLSAERRALLKGLGVLVGHERTVDGDATSRPCGNGRVSPGVILLLALDGELYPHVLPRW